VFFLVLTAALGSAVYGEGFDEKLPLSSHQRRALMEEAATMEAPIQKRQQQQQVAVGADDSKEYEAGFSDGYNKAIVDLVKSRLLNDKSLLPKPMPTLQRTRYSAQTAEKSVEQNISQQTVPAAGEPDTTSTAGTPPLDDPYGTNGTNGTKEAPTASGVTSAVTTITTTAVTSSPEAMTGPVAEAVTDVDTNRTSAENAKANSPSQQPTVSNNSAPAHDTAQTWLQKSNSYLQAKDWPQAINAATSALSLDAWSVNAYIVRSVAYAENGQIQNAFDDIAAALSLDPKNALAYNNKAFIYELTNNPDKAQENYEKACELRYQPACITVEKNKQVKAGGQKVKIDQLTNLSYQQFQQKDWKAVIQTTTELLALDPENTVALANRAGAYTELGLYNNAMDDCNNALIIDPKMAVAYNNKGYILELMGKPKKAALEYETACVLGLQQSCSDFKRLSNKSTTR